MNTKIEQITVPAGYKVVLVPDTSPEIAPDYAECARQATATTGMQNIYGSPWLSIFCREINRWCVHSSVEDQAIAENEESLTLRQKFESWATHVDRCGVLRIDRDADGQYVSDLTRVAWESCKATAGVTYHSYEPQPVATIVVKRGDEPNSLVADLGYSSKHSLNKIIDGLPDSGEACVNLFTSSGTVETVDGATCRKGFEARMAAENPVAWSLYKIGEMPVSYCKKIDDAWFGWQRAMASIGLDAINA